MGAASDPLSPEFFLDSREAGADLARVDWEATPLGRPADWPQSLRTTVDTMLSSRFSMWMAWGPELTFFCNDAYRRDTLGRKYPWALGRPASQVWDEIWPDVGPRIEKVLTTGEATWDEGLLLFLERSGYTEETYHTFSYSPLRDDDGGVVGMLCVVSEDTARVIGERRMATLRDLGSDPTVVRTEEEMLAFTSHQLERNPQDLPFTLTYLFDGSGGARLAASTGFPAGRPATTERLTDDSVWPLSDAAEGRLTLVELDGGRIGETPCGAWPDPPVQAMVTPLVAQGGEPMGFLVAGLNRYRPFDADYRGFIGLVATHIAGGIASARSYSAQQQRAEQLAELDRAKTMFFSNISHEFRTPLTLILGPLAELASNTTDLSRQVREEIDVAYRNGLRLSKLVNTLLDFSRLEAGRMQAHYRPVDLGAVTAELASVFRSATDRAGLELLVDCPPLEHPAYIDCDMWEKVIFNLLSNAVKFTLSGSITVAARIEGSDAVVTVTDTGIGIPAHELTRLFERFHRIQTNAARSTEGSGIGLALVKELVTLHGGTITAASTEGAGTTFTIRLPLGAEHLPSEALSGPTHERAPSGHPGQTYVQEALRWSPEPARKVDGSAADLLKPEPSSSALPTTVLIADDNADMRDYLARLLQAAGHLVTTVTDGRQALEAVRNRIPDLVISDVMMPHIGGLELVAALRKDPRTSMVPVVLLSARAGQEASIEGLQAGADDYLVKPFSSDELLARVETNIALSRLRNRHARWRSALIDSLQEAFFVCAADGAMVEINKCFTDMVGYGPEGLPYRPPFPWWPDAVSQAEDYRRITTAFASAQESDLGPTPFPIYHRDGHRLWVDITSTRAVDPSTGEFVTVGTFRDVTEEHYRAQRESALSELNAQLAQAENVHETVLAATRQLQRAFEARQVIAATFPDSDVAGEPVWGEPDVVSAGRTASWPELPQATRDRIVALAHGRDILVPHTESPGSAAICLQHPAGLLVIWTELGEHRQFGTEERNLLTVLTSRLTQGLQRVHQFDQQRETALALQHAILGPSELPAGFVARYQPATRPLEVGGDWFDVAALGDGRIAMVVGDCVGHGLAAATVMGQLRSACRALLLEHLDPADTLTGLDRFASGLDGARCTTACAAVLDPATGELTYSAAGHPPPIVVSADGDAVLLADGRSVPLGLQPERPRPVATATVSPGATVLLYTDGLVERRGASLDAGISRVAAVIAEEHAAGLQQLADRLMEALCPDGGYHDDVAILLYRRPQPLTLTFPARATEISLTRAVLRDWLSAEGVAPQLACDVLLAAGEAVSNAVEHGHRSHPDGPVTLSATVTGGRLHISVTDTGKWKPPDPATDNRRGRGLGLMRALMDDVNVQTTNHGTSVNMWVSLQ